MVSVMQVVNPHVRVERGPVEAVRSVTVLGATGSVGASTVDLLKRGNGRYAVEAVTANKNGAQLAQIARDLNARFAVVADPAAYDDLKAALAGSGIQAGCGESAMIEAAQRPADWVMAAVIGAVGLKPTLAALCIQPGQDLRRIAARSPGRGSGASPRKRAAPRASRTWTRPVKASRTSLQSATAAVFMHG